MNARKFGKYEVIEKIGQGGMGEVFKARDPLLKRDVAIKTVTASVSGDDDLRHRFEREAQLAAGLNHPNIVHIYDFGEEGGKIYMAMELLLGKDLKAAIKSNALSTLDDKLALMEDVCEGLAFAHYREIVHRDLKPANIHIQPDGRAKIMDFGLARLESSDMTRTGVIMGTPDYMAPEQVQGGKADPRSDVYSLGAVFYELITGRRPFQAESTHALLFQVLYNQPEPIQKLDDDLPTSVVEIVERAMSKDPASRFQNGGEMRDALRKARTSLKAGDSDATLVADMTMVGQTPIPGLPGPTTPRPGSGPVSGPASTPRRGQPGTPIPPTPMSGGISAYPPSTAPGGLATASRGTVGPGSVMTPGSQGFGTFSQPTIVVQKSYGGLLVGLGIAALAIIMVVLYVTGNLPGFPREDSAAAAQVSQLQHDLLSRDLESAAEKLRQRDFDGAMAVVERVLGKEPANSEALGIQQQIETTLADLDRKTGEARAALEDGDHSEAASIVAGVLEVHPSYGPALSLSKQLDAHFKGQAGGARGEMDQARRRANEAGATSLGGYVTAASVAGEAQALFEQGSFVQATGKFRAAAEGFEAARREAQRQAQQTKPEPTKPTAPPPDPSAAEAARQAMGRARRQAESTEGAASLGSYVAAAGLAQEGESFFGQREYPLAAAKFGAAAEGFEAARREAVRIAQQKPKPPEPVPPSVQPPAAQPVQAPPQKPVDETAAIRDVVRKYEEVFEKKNLGLYEQIKPNVSAKEVEGLQRVFDRVTTYDVAVEINSIQVDGNEATVSILRQDTIDGKSRPRISQTLFLTKSSARGWIIERLGQ